jgi:hypothetical protein
LNWPKKLAFPANLAHFELANIGQSFLGNYRRRPETHLGMQVAAFESGRIQAEQHSQSAALIILVEEILENYRAYRPLSGEN